MTNERKREIDRKSYLNNKERQKSLRMKIAFRRALKLMDDEYMACIESGLYSMSCLLGMKKMIHILEVEAIRRGADITNLGGEAE